MALFQTSPKGLHIDTQPPRGFYLPYVYIIFIQYLIHDYTTYKLFFYYTHACKNKTMALVRF